MATIWEDFTFPGSSLRRRVGFDEATKKIVVQTQDPNTEEVIALNNTLRNAERASSSLWGDQRYVRVASVPLIQIEKWYREGLNFYDPNDYPRIKRLLNDGEYRGLRTAPGRI